MKFYISEKEAKGLGFTHHGYAYGLPVWVDPESITIAIKFFPFEYLFDIIEVFLALTGAPLALKIGKK